MEDEDPWGLAQASSATVSGIAASLIKTASRADAKLSTLGGLMTRLWLVCDVLAKPDPIQQATLWRRLSRVLKIIEDLCTWHMSEADVLARYGKPGTRFPTLRNLIAPSQSTKSSTEVKNQVTESLSAFASGRPKLIEQYFKKLDGFSQLKKSPSQQYQVEQRSDQFVLTDDIPPEVHQNLYKTLKRYSACACSPSKEQHWGRLRLKDRFQTLESDLLFDTVFAEIPLSSPEAMEWQQLQLHVSRRLHRQKIVKFSAIDIAEPCSEPESKKEISREIELGQFCSLLGTPRGRFRMRLRVLEGKLLELYGPEVADQHILPTSSVPLKHVLELHELKSTGKIILAYILAKSVWQFYSSDWMQTPWSTGSIHFMREQPSSTSDGLDAPEINPSDPYFAFDFDNPTSNLSLEHYDSWYVLHQYPRILALGVLLVEICRGKSKKGRAFEAHTLEERINNDFSSSWEAMQSSSWPDLKFRNNAVRDTYRAVAEVCLSKDVLSSTQDVEERRNILRKRVVCPLGKLLEDIGLIDQSGLVKRIDHDRLSSNVVLGSDHGTSFLADDVSSKPSKLWIENLISSRLAQDLHTHTKAGCSPRVRVAVLDTGYDPESPFFCHKLRKNRIQGWKDWVSNSPKHQDEDGHGTHVVSLAMKIAPQADIYVARIAEDAKGLQKASQTVAEAIKWATENCKADIVSMSFGYPKETLVNGEQVISKAILQAVLKRDHRVLFFAAGGNFGGNQKEMFPASHDFVIPIRSTDHEGAFQGFNPPPNYRGLDVFGTLGKDVSAAWLSTHDGEKAQTGTSVATPIAAGMAAMVLADARLMLETSPASTEELVSRLWTKAGMRSMFEALSTQTSWKCLYLCPREFARSSLEDRHDLIIHAARQV